LPPRPVPTGGSEGKGRRDTGNHDTPVALWPSRWRQDRQRWRQRRRWVGSRWV